MKSVRGLIIVCSFLLTSVNSNATDWKSFLDSLSVFVEGRIDFSDSMKYDAKAKQKMYDIFRCVVLKEHQVPELYAECFDYALRKDSCKLLKDDTEYQSFQFITDSIFNCRLFEIMTDSQAIVYARHKGMMDVKMKTKEKMYYLENSKLYSKIELAAMERRIFQYLMLEKLVYMRDKYDLVKQKMNIQSLKNVQPKCLKEAETRRKLINRGDIVDGKINWNR
ncbi:MAG: hypothetical protein HUJ96_00970 [Marinilabiliaceae bacterium]|nr:hypothetical protein [Marinilabiliaceae bacterium]